MTVLALTEPECCTIIAAFDEPERRSVRDCFGRANAEPNPELEALACRISIAFPFSNHGAVEHCIL